MLIEDLFEEGNAGLLRQMEAGSNLIIKQMEQKNKLDLMGTGKEFKSPFMEKAGIAEGENLVTSNATSQFAYTGNDVNNNAGYEYLVATIPYDDGAKVYDGYVGQSVEKHELYLFYEHEKDKNNLFGTFCVSKTGSYFHNLVEKLLNRETHIRGKLYGKEVEGGINNFNRLVSYVHEVAKNEPPYSAVYNAISREFNSKMIGPQILEAVSSVDELIASGLNWLADKMDGAMLTEESYEPGREDYDPIIGFSNDAESTQMSVNLFDDISKSELFKDAEAVVKSVYHAIGQAMEYAGKLIVDLMPESVRAVVYKVKQLLQRLKDGVKNIIATITNFIISKN